MSELAKKDKQPMSKITPTPGRETMSAVRGTPHLFVRKHPSGIRTYIFRYRKKGHAYKAALGRVGILKLEDAKDAVATYVGEIVKGIDPIATRKLEAEQRIAAREAERQVKIEAESEAVFSVRAMIAAWATSHGKNDERSVTYVRSNRKALETALEPALDLPARDLSKDRIEKLLAAVERRGPAAAARAQSAINAAFRWAIRISKLQANPCAALDQPKLKPRQRTLSAIEVKRIWRAAGTLPPPLGEYVRFLASTCVRRNEALFAKWGEVDGDLLILPADRMKAKREFSQPLSPAALRSLPPRGKPDDFIFSRTNGKQAIGGLNRLKTMLDAAIEADGAGPLASWSFHHLRHAAVTWLADQGVDYAICDLILAHGIPLGRSGRTYQRSYKISERRQALNLWSGLLDPEPVAHPTLRVIK
jgi:integrase